MSDKPTLTPGNLAGLPIQQVSKTKVPYLNILVYGDSGVGKTTFAGSADAVPDLRPVLFIDIEGGTFSLQNAGHNVDVVRVTTWKEMQELYNTLYAQVAAGTCPYQTIVLDSLTEIQKFNMYNVMEDLIKKKPDQDPDIPGMREWGKNIEQLRRFVRAFRDLELHTIFTALARVDKDDRTGVRWTKPSLSGKLADEVAAFLDIVVYYYVKQVQDPNNSGGTINNRYLLTQKTESQIAKDRSGRLPIVVEEPSMKAVFDLIYPPTAKA
jgi:hypothetical protein